MPLARAEREREGEVQYIGRVTVKRKAVGNRIRGWHLPTESIHLDRIFKVNKKYVKKKGNINVSLTG